MKKTAKKTVPSAKNKTGWLEREATLTDNLEKAIPKVKDEKKKQFLINAYLYGAHLGD